MGGSPSKRYFYLFCVILLALGGFASVLGVATYEGARNTDGVAQAAPPSTLFENSEPRVLEY